MKHLHEDIQKLLRNPRLCMQYLLIALFLLIAGATAVYYSKVNQSAIQIEASANSIDHLLSSISISEVHTAHATPELLRRVDKAQQEAENIKTEAKEVTN